MATSHRKTGRRAVTALFSGAMVFALAAGPVLADTITDPYPGYTKAALASAGNDDTLGAGYVAAPHDSSTVKFVLTPTRDLVAIVQGKNGYATLYNLDKHTISLVNAGEAARYAHYQDASTLLHYLTVEDGYAKYHPATWQDVQTKPGLYFVNLAGTPQFKPDRKAPIFRLDTRNTTAEEEHAETDYHSTTTVNDQKLGDNPDSGNTTFYKETWNRDKNPYGYKFTRTVDLTKKTKEPPVVTVLAGSGQRIIFTVPPFDKVPVEKGYMPTRWNQSTDYMHGLGTTNFFVATFVEQQKPVIVNKDGERVIYANVSKSLTNESFSTLEESSPLQGKIIVSQMQLCTKYSNGNEEWAVPDCIPFTYRVVYPYIPPATSLTVTHNDASAAMAAAQPQPQPTQPILAPAAETTPKPAAATDSDTPTSTATAPEPATVTPAASTSSNSQTVNVNVHVSGKVTWVPGQPPAPAPSSTASSGAEPTPERPASTETGTGTENTAGTVTGTPVGNTTTPGTVDVGTQTEPVDTETGTGTSGGTATGTETGTGGGTSGGNVTPAGTSTPVSQPPASMPAPQPQPTVTVTATPPATPGNSTATSTAPAEPTSSTPTTPAPAPSRFTGRINYRDTTVDTGQSVTVRPRYRGDDNNSLDDYVFINLKNEKWVTVNTNGKVTLAPDSTVKPGDYDVRVGVVRLEDLPKLLGVSTADVDDLIDGDTTLDDLTGGDSVNTHSPLVKRTIFTATVKMAPIPQLAYPAVTVKAGGNGARAQGTLSPKPQAGQAGKYVYFAAGNPPWATINPVTGMLIVNPDVKVQPKDYTFAAYAMTVPDAAKALGTTIQKIDGLLNGTQTVDSILGGTGQAALQYLSTSQSQDYPSLTVTPVTVTVTKPDHTAGTPNSGHNGAPGAGNNGPGTNMRAASTGGSNTQLPGVQGQMRPGSGGHSISYTPASLPVTGSALTDLWRMAAGAGAGTLLILAAAYTSTRRRQNSAATL